MTGVGDVSGGGAPGSLPGGSTGGLAGGSTGSPSGGSTGGPSRGLFGPAPGAVGIGWRPEIDLTVERLSGVDFVEVIAENVCADHPDHLPASLRVLRERGTQVVPHGVALGLGGADRPDAARLARLAGLAAAVDAPLVSEHLAFVRAGGMEAGHLLPVPRTRAALRVIAENVRVAQDALPVPLALENPATLFAWPDNELTEAQFLAELVAMTGVLLLVDVANLHTERVNHGVDAAAALDALPLESVAYVHVAGGVLTDGIWHDTHAHPVSDEVLEILGMLCERRVPPGVLLERDAAFPPADELQGELTAIRARLRGAPSRTEDAASSSARDAATGVLTGGGR